MVSSLLLLLLQLRLLLLSLLLLPLLLLLLVHVVLHVVAVIFVVVVVFHLQVDSNLFDPLINNCKYLFYLIANNIIALVGHSHISFCVN